MTREQYNLLMELNVTLYEEARSMNKAELLAEDDVTMRDYNARKRLFLLAANIIHDLTYYEGTHIGAMIDQGIKQKLTLYHTDMQENLEKVMPPP